MPVTSGSTQVSDTAQINPGVIVDSDINASAAIADTKLAQITTAGKVSGAALTSLASIPAGAGVIPTANIPTSDNPRVFAMPLGVSGGATLTVDATDRSNVVTMNNGTDNLRAYFNVMVPRGYTSISSVKVLLKSTANSGNIDLRVVTTKLPGSSEAAASTDATAGNATYTGPATIGQWGQCSLNANNFDGISCADGDVIGFELTRDGATDAHAGNITVAGLFVTFA